MTISAIVVNRASFWGSNRAEVCIKPAKVTDFHDNLPDGADISDLSGPDIQLLDLTRAQFSAGSLPNFHGVDGLMVKCQLDGDTVVFYNGQAFNLTQMQSSAEQALDFYSNEMNQLETKVNRLPKDQRAGFKEHIGQLNSKLTDLKSSLEELKDYTNESTNESDQLAKIKQIETIRQEAITQLKELSEQMKSNGSFFHEITVCDALMGLLAIPFLPFLLLFAVAGVLSTGPFYLVEKAFEGVTIRQDSNFAAEALTKSKIESEQDLRNLYDTYLQQGTVVRDIDELITRVDQMPAAEQSESIGQPEEPHVIIPGETPTMNAYAN